MPEENKINSNTTSSSPSPTNPASAPEKVDKIVDKPIDKPKPASELGKPVEPKPETISTPAPQTFPEPITPEIEPGESIPKEPGEAEVKIEEKESEILAVDKKEKEEEIGEETKEKNAIDEMVEQAKEEVKTIDQQAVEIKEEPKVKKEVKPEIPVSADKPSYAEASEGKEEEKIKVVAPPEAAPIVPFTLKFLKHLGILRGQANQKRQKNIQARLDKIMTYAIKHQKITNDDVERLTGVGHRQAVRYLNILVKDKKLVRFGKKSNIFYKPIN